MRKKLTMLMASLLLVVGTAWADAPVPEQRYRLKNVMTGLYMQANGSSNLQLQEQKYSVLQFFSVEDAGNGKFYLKSESGANLYVNASGWDAVVGSGDSKTPYTITLVNGETDVYTLDQTVAEFIGKIGANANTAGTSLYCNKGEENYGKWQFEAVASPEVCTFDPTKTYRIKSEYSGLYMQLMSTGTSGTTEGAFQLKDKSIVAEGQKFMFEAAGDGKYYLKTVTGGNTYYVNQGYWNFHAGAEATTPFTIAVVDGHTAVYSLHQTVDEWNSSMHGYAGNSTTSATDGTKIYCNSPLAGNTIWSFEEVVADPNNITEQTQLTNDSYYKISGERGFIFGADGVVKGTNAVSQAYSEGNKDQHFAIISKNDKLYLYNVGAKKFVVKSGNNTKLVDLPEQPITLEKTSNKDYAWSILLNGTNKINLSSGWNSYGVYTDYNTEDSGNRWLIYKVGTFDPTEALAAFDKVYVTVNYVFGSRETITKVETIAKGKTFSLRNPSIYTTVTSCTAGSNALTETDGAYSFTVNEATTVTMNLKEDALPFTPSANFANAAWHVMRIRPVRNSTEEFNWVSKTDATPYTFSAERPTADEGLWAFVGNFVDGFKIYNKAAGEASTLGVNGSNVVLQSGVKTWTVGKCIENGNHRGFYLYEGTENKYVHEMSGKFQIWNSSSAPTDGGSALVAYHPLTITYMFEDAEVAELKVDTYVAPGTVYTIENTNAFINDFKSIKSCEVNGNEVPATDGVWNVTVNGATTVTVTLAALEITTRPYYALKSATGTYLGLTAKAEGLVADGVYTITGDANGKRGYMVAGEGYTEGDKSYPVLSDITYSGCEGNSVTAIENGKNWYVYTTAVGTYIYNIGAGKFLANEWNNINLSDTPYPWNIVQNGSYTSIYDNTMAKYLSMGCGRTAANRPVAWDGNANDGGAQHTFTAVADGATTFATQIVTAQTAIAKVAPSFQNVPLYLYYTPTADGAVFEYKDEAGKYLGFKEWGWNVVTDRSVWTIQEAGSDGFSHIVRSTDATKHLGSSVNTQVGTGIYSNVDANCNQWTFEGLYKDYPTTATTKDGKRHFTSERLFYAGACNVLRFTLTKSAGKFKTGQNRMSLDEFKLYDIKGEVVELQASDVTGNNGKTYAGMFDGVNGKYAGTATWNDGNEDDWFEITLPNGVDLGGAFSFSFVTENTAMDAQAFDIAMSYKSSYYVLNIVAPYGYSVTATYDGTPIANGGVISGEFDEELLEVSAIDSYEARVTVDSDTHVVTVTYVQVAAIENPASVVALVNRIGGTGTDSHFKFVLDHELDLDGETFFIGSEGSKILIKGTTLSAITTGLGWYLNNIAHINIAWNSLNEKTTTVKWNENAGYADLSNLPLPAGEETHTSDAKYRYYLNYCTFGYSMTSWTWTRWQQEIDWMALHGINMPLQIIGLEEVWRKFLTMPKYKYTAEQAKAFVAGPAFTAWWGMNNLEGWGGTKADGTGGVQDDAWYVRQKELAGKIVAAQRALGMEPVLPGFSGMVPTNFQSISGFETRSNGGNWAGGFVRPLILSVSNANYAEIAADYYACLKEVMGESKYYSMDPFHEDGGTGTTEDYKALYDAMAAANSNSQWVIQQWQWKSHQALSLGAVPAGKLIVLDLFSDGSPAFDSYNGYAPQEAVFCAIPNFGGRSGLMGRLQNVTDNYFKFKGKYTSIKGIGTAPEAIEQTPVTYDLIYQLPWMNGEKPNVEEWVNNYSIARYGKDNAVVKEAWSLLRQGPLNYGADGIQGPVEDVWAARPNLNANPASAWGKTLANAGGTYTPARRQMLIDAVYKLIDQEDELALTNGSVYKSNYMYDLVEFGGAVMADYAYDLLLGIKAAKNAEGTNGATYKARRDAFLQLILDMDAFRGTNLNFRLGKWTQEARDAATEVEGATTATPNWYEYNNARTILSTWSSPGTNLTDYSYRSWQGLLKDYYYKRWKYYFDNNCTNGEYKYFEWNWAHGKEHYVGQTGFSNVDLTPEQDGHTSKYTREPVGNTVEKAVEMLGKYIIPVAMADGTHYAYRYLTNDLSSKVTIIAAGNSIDLTQYFGNLQGATVTGDFINGGSSTDLANIPLNSGLDGAYTGTITLADGTVLTFGVTANPGYNGAYLIKYSGDPVFIQYHNVGDNAGNVGYKVVTTKKGNGGSTGYKADYEADKIFTIVPSGTGYALSAQGQYLKTTVSSGWNHIMFSDQKGDAGTYVFTEANNVVKLKSTNNSGMPHVAIFDNGAWGNDVEGKAIGFTIEKVTTYAITVPESDYFGICLPFNVVLPTGMTAYDVTVESLTCGEDGAITSLTSIATEGQILKAGTPALLKATAGNYNLTITMDNTNAKSSSPASKLRGNFVKQTLTSGNLNKFIYTAEGEYPFVRINGEQEIPANTCWIEANIGAQNVEVTEVQGKLVKVDDWLFTYDDATNGIKLIDAAVSGDGDLKIKSDYIINGKTQKVVAISPDFMHGNETLTKVTLPASLVNLGFREVEPWFEGKYEGKKGDGATYDGSTLVGEAVGLNREFVFPNDPKTENPYVVGKDFAWRMTLDVTIDSVNCDFNNFGSAIVSTNPNSLADDFYGYLQIFLHKEHKNIVVRLDNNDDSYLYNTKALDEQGNETSELLVMNSFRFELEHDGSGGYQVVIYYENGKAKMYNISASENNKVQDFDRLYYSLPEGIHVNVKFEKLISQGLFVGCTNLKRIEVDPANPTFKSCDHGVLYDKNGYYVMRIPEGGTDHYSIPSKVVKLYPGAVHGVKADVILHSNPQIGVVKGHEEDVKNVKFHLVIDDDKDVIDFNSNNANTFETVEYKRAFSNKDVYGTIMLPFVPNEESLSKITFFEFESGDANTLTFKEVTAVQPNTPYLFTMKEDGITSLEGGVTTITAVTNYTSENTNGNWTSVGCYKTDSVITNNAGETNSYYGLNNNKQFVRVTKKINTKPYRAYYKMAPSANGEAPAAKFSLIFRDGSTQVITPSQIEGWEENIYYDLMGRRVLNPTNGIYIVNGKKVIVK